mgnify:FL=1
MNRPAGVRAKGRGREIAGLLTKRCAPFRGASSVSPKRGLFLDLFEIALVDAANRACPVVGNLLERRSGGDASVGIADCGIVDPLADYTTILFHLLLVL